MNLNCKKIKCPVCGCEYLPSEIYYPNDFLGTPKNIIKNANGVIENWVGDSMNPVEEYTCDNCGTPFIVEAEINFKTYINDLHNFKEDYATSIYKNRMTLDEPSTPEYSTLFDSEGN